LAANHPTTPSYYGINPDRRPLWASAGPRHRPIATAKTRQRTSPSQKHWEVYHLGRAGKRLGTVEAADAEEALLKAIDEFDIKPRDVSRALVRETS
jgi:hypothetical protein